MAGSTTFSNVTFEVVGFTNLVLEVPEMTMTGIERSVRFSPRGLHSIHNKPIGSGRRESKIDAQLAAPELTKHA